MSSSADDVGEHQTLIDSPGFAYGPAAAQLPFGVRSTTARVYLRNREQVGDTLLDVVACNTEAQLPNSIEQGWLAARCTPT